MMAARATTHSSDYKQENAVLVLLDLDFFMREVTAARRFYSDLYSGRTVGFDHREFPQRISTNRLLDALSHFYSADLSRSTLCVFCNEKFGHLHLLDDDTGAYVELVKGIKTYAMLDAVRRNANSQAFILIADGPGYELLIHKLRASEIDLLLIRHRQEDSDDISHMPNDIRYQYADYIAGLTLGLTIDEL